MISITRVEELVDRLARPTYVLRMAHGTIHRDGSLGRSARSRYALAERQVAAIIDDVTGSVATEVALWDRVEVAEMHARRFREQAVAAGRIGEDMRAQVLRESHRIYQVKAEAFLEAIALLRVAGSTSQVALAHALKDVGDEFERRMPR